MSNKIDFKRIKMKDTKKQREKDEPEVKTKSPHSIGSPSKPSTSSSSAAASNVIKITKKSHAIQKRTADKKANSVQTKLMSVKNENGTRSVIVSKVSTNSAATANAKTVATAASVILREINKDRNDKRLVKDDSKRVATQVESKVSVEEPPLKNCYQNKHNQLQKYQ